MFETNFEIQFYKIQLVLNPDKFVANRVITMETFVALSICPNFQASALSEPNTNKHYCTSKYCNKTNFQMTPWVKVNPGFYRVYERLPQKNYNFLILGPTHNNFKNMSLWHNHLSSQYSTKKKLFTFELRKDKVFSAVKNKSVYIR